MFIFITTYKLLIDFISFHVNIWIQFKFVAKKCCPPSIPVEVFHNWTHILLQEMPAKHWIGHYWIQSLWLRYFSKSDLFARQLNWLFEKISQVFKNVSKSVSTIQILAVSALEDLDHCEQRDVMLLAHLALWNFTYANFVPIILIFKLPYHVHLDTLILHCLYTCHVHCTVPTCRPCWIK